MAYQFFALFLTIAASKPEGAKPEEKLPKKISAAGAIGASAEARLFRIYLSKEGIFEAQPGLQYESAGRDTLLVRRL